MSDPQTTTRIFDEFDLVGGQPVWSSWRFDQWAQLVDPAGAVRELDHYLADHAVPLSGPVANFIKEITVALFQHDRTSYGLGDWNWPQDEGWSISAVQAYLRLLAVPPDRLDSSGVVPILKALAESDHFDQALRILSEEFERPEIRKQLDEWRSNGIPRHTADRIEMCL